MNLFASEVAGQIAHKFSRKRQREAQEMENVIGTYSIEVAMATVKKAILE